MSKIYVTVITPELIKAIEDNQLILNNVTEGE
jgi:hypothetical protein